MTGIYSENLLYKQKVFDSQNAQYIKIDKVIKKIRINRSEDKSHVKKPEVYNYTKTSKVT